MDTRLYLANKDVSEYCLHISILTCIEVDLRSGHSYVVLCVTYLTIAVRTALSCLVVVCEGHTLHRVTCGSALQM